MATKAQCAYCFEALYSSLRKEPFSRLGEVEKLWTSYTDQGKPVRSVTSVESPSTEAQVAEEESYPLFVTWNTLYPESEPELRGCIGTFDAKPLSSGLKDYALIAALQDHRFTPITANLIPKLQVCVTLLTNFSDPDNDARNWTIGQHGLRISFTGVGPTDAGKRYGATYLPHVAEEQGWTKEETLTSLMRKAGWQGSKSKWEEVKDLTVVRYEGHKMEMDYTEWKKFKDWVESRDS